MEAQQLSWLLHLLLGCGKKLNLLTSELGEEVSNLLAVRSALLKDEKKSDVRVRIPLPSAERDAIVSF